MRILVTGGAGYIGSHMVATLLRGGHHVVVVDNLSAGHREVVPSAARFAELDVRDRVEMTNLLREEKIEAIFHFASRIQVGESVSNPRLYWRDNLSAAVELLEAALDSGVDRFILSSTAAVYGNPLEVPIPEDHPTEPVNVYGESKLAIEKMLRSYSKAYGLRYAALRYFNAAGADAESGLGERHDPETHLLPLILETAAGRRKSITIYGRDYPTPDGTCIRDYIHVVDLAEAHLAALEYLNRGGESGAFNLGTGVGHSVREVITVAKEISGKEITVEVGPRRPGDPPALVASPKRAEELLGWRAQRGKLSDIVRDAWKWHSRAQS
jgi:UDP-glucose 4-epimerase